MTDIPLRAEKPFVTAQLAIGGSEAYVATCSRRAELGSNGEVYIASIWRSVDGGHSWSALGWRRALRVFVSRAVLAPWPPEYVMKMELRAGALEVEFREDWGAEGRPGEDFETGYHTEPIWHATLEGRRWSIRMHRRWRLSDGLFGPHPIAFDLAGFQPPPCLV